LLSKWFFRVAGFYFAECVWSLIACWIRKFYALQKKKLAASNINSLCASGLLWVLCGKRLASTYTKSVTCSHNAIQQNHLPLLLLPPWWLKFWRTCLIFSGITLFPFLSFRNPSQARTKVKTANTPPMTDPTMVDIFAALPNWSLPIPDDGLADVVELDWDSADDGIDEVVDFINIRSYRSTDLD